MKIRPILVNVAVLCISSVIGFFFCEVAARRLLNAADYLSVEMVRDEILGAVPSTNTRAGGFDAWGFRNRVVPDAADIVAIGDSHTYGNTATMEDSWPYVLGRLSGRRVYNMGLGGYGPNQYLELLRTKAIRLKPRMVVVGLYMGDDFENAFLITYGLEHWAYLRTLPAEKVNFDIWEPPPPPTWHKNARVWLSRHSVVYQLAFHASPLGRVQGEMQIRNAHQHAESVTSLAVPEKNILEAFLPKGILRRLDQGSESVREGMRITFKLLAEMKAISRQNHAEFLVAVIPTKEMVFAEYLEHNPHLPLSDVLDRLLMNERLARERTFDFLRNAEIAFVDTLPALRSSLAQELYARTAADIHPSRNGYRVIAQAIFEASKELPRRDRQSGGKDTNPSR
jgi:hypothetical protein